MDGEMQNKQSRHISLRSAVYFYNHEIIKIQFPSFPCCSNNRNIISLFMTVSDNKLKHLFSLQMKFLMKCCGLCLQFLFRFCSFGA